MGMKQFKSKTWAHDMTELGANSTIQNFLESPTFDPSSIPVRSIVPWFPFSALPPCRIYTDSICHVLYCVELKAEIQVENYYATMSGENSWKRRRKKEGRKEETATFNKLICFLLRLIVVVRSALRAFHHVWVVLGVEGVLASNQHYWYI